MRMNYLPPPPRALSPSMQRTARFSQGLALLLFAGTLVAGGAGWFMTQDRLEALSLLDTGMRVPGIVTKSWSRVHRDSKGRQSSTTYIVTVEYRVGDRVHRVTREVDAAGSHAVATDVAFDPRRPERGIPECARGYLSLPQPEEAIAWGALLPCLGIGIYFVVYAWRQSGLVRCGIETVGDADPQMRRVTFSAEGRPVSVEGIPYDLGAVSGSGPMLYDPRSPTRMTAVRLEMLTPDLVEELVASRDPLLPPPSRAPNPLWMSSRRPWFTYIAAGFGVFACLLWIWLTVALQDKTTVGMVLLAGGGVVLLAGTVVAMLMGWRARAQSAALWRDGIECRGRIRRRDLTSLSYELAAGDILVKGSRNFAPGEGTAGPEVIVLIDALDPENRAVVLDWEVPGFNASSTSGRF